MLLGFHLLVSVVGIGLLETLELLGKEDGVAHEAGADIRGIQGFFLRS